MDETTKIQLGALAGAGAVLLGAYYVGKRQRAVGAGAAASAESVDQERLRRREEAAATATTATAVVAATTTLSSSSSAAAAAEDTCECGLTIAQGGCAQPSSSTSTSAAFNAQLLGTVKKYEKHFIICSGTDPDEWGAKIDKDEGSFAQLAKRAINARKAELTFKFKLTNSDEKSKTSDGTDLIVFPERIRYIGVTAETMPFIVEDHLVNGSVSERVKHEPFESEMVLVCCHNNRDTRCGSEGPVIVDAFNRLLSARGLGEDKVVVRRSSHLGGHKYAGVVVLYPRGDWFGFISEQQVELLLDNYIQHGSMVPEFWRGRMGIDKQEAKDLANSVTLAVNTSS